MSNKFSFMNFILKINKGFTIIELIISIFLLSAAVVGIFSAFLMMTILTSSTTDRLTATYLTQEGMEIVRNIRDENWLNMDAGYPIGATWVDMLDCAQGCEADYTTGTSVSGAWEMSPWASSPLYVNNVSGFYGYNTNNATKTKFKRKIIITPVTDVDNDSEHIHIIKVVVQVSWDEKANILYVGRSADSCDSSNCIKAEGTLYNWYNYVLQ